MRHDLQEPTLTALFLSSFDRVAAPLTGGFSRRRVKHWCRRQGLQLLRWRDAKLFEGPSTWTVDHNRYRIQVLDEEGRRRSGYLAFKRWWSRAQRAQVLWDEPGRARANGAVAGRPRLVERKY